jgi:hypothetical protein
MTDAVTETQEVTKEVTEEVTEQVTTGAETPEATPATEETKGVTEEVSTEETTEATEEGANKEAPEGLDFTSYYDEFEEKGELSEESFEALAAAGLPREMVETYIAANSSAFTTADAENLVKSVGGKEAYVALTEWAKDNLSEEQLEQYNDSLATKAGAKIAVQWLQAQHRAKEGYDPETVIEGGATPTNKPKGFASRAEQSKAINDRRYGSDRAYTAEVQAKVRASNF